MVIMKLLPFQQVKIFGRLVVADKEYARNLLEISMNHLQSRSFRLRVSLKKIMQCATIIWLENVRTNLKKIFSKYRKIIRKKMN